MTPEQQAVLEKAKARIAAEKQLSALDTESDKDMVAQKKAAALKRATSSLESKKARAAEEAANPKPPDQIADDTLDVAGEFAGAFNRTVLQGADLVLSPLRGISNAGAYLSRQKGMPTLVDTFEGVSGGSSGFMEEGFAKDTVQTLGTAATFIPALAPVTRGSNAVSLALDFMGAGATTAGRAQLLAEATERAVKAAPTPPKDLLDMSDDELWDVLYQFGKREKIEKNLDLMDEVEAKKAIIANRQKQADKAAAKKGQKGPDPVVTEDLNIPVAREGVSLPDVQKAFLQGIDPERDKELYNKLFVRIADLARKKGGFRYTDDIEELAEAHKIFTGASKARSVGPIRKWFMRNTLPVSQLLNDVIDPRVGSAFERGVETALRTNADFIDNYLIPMRGVVDFVNKTPAAKALLLDMWDEPENLNKFRGMIARELGSEQLQQFNRFWDYSQSKNTEAMKRLYIRDEKNQWDVNYLHTNKKGDKQPGLDQPIGSPYSLKVDSLQTRSRKKTADMDEADFLMYENPLLSHAKHLTDQENLLELQKRFGLRPSLPKNGTSKDFFSNGIYRRLLNDGMDKETAQLASNLMHEAWVGSTKAPPPAVRTFMNLAYAGTLAQFKSAVLNLHDIAVSMVNNGTVPTLKAVFQNMEGTYGKTVRDMLGKQNFGEFVRNYDGFISDPTLWDKVSAGSRVVADGAMFVSGFRYMDELGKGVVLRAAVNEATEAAKKGLLHQKYGNLFRKYELDAISPWLRKGVPPKDMPPHIQQKIEELAFTKLGEQQLISMAGRPLGYLHHPMARPLYAMTGFAIKQMALLRKNVYNEMKQGNYALAGQYAAKYAVYAGLGYGMINETRNAVFKGEEFEPEGILLGAVDQIAAAMTLNRLGDDYSRQMFADNPVEYLMTSVLPPGGLVEAFGKAIMGDFDDLKYRIPALGDFIKRYEKENE